MANKTVMALGLAGLVCTSGCSSILDLGDIMIANDRIAPKQPYSASQSHHSKLPREQMETSQQHKPNLLPAEKHDADYADIKIYR